MHEDFPALELLPGAPVQAEECQDLGFKVLLLGWWGTWWGGGISGTLKAESAEAAYSKLGLMEAMVKFSGVIYLFMHKYKVRIKVLPLQYLFWLDVYAPVGLNKDGCNSGHAAA